MAIPQAARDSAAARAVRDALEQDAVLQAREHFLSLPGLDAHHGAWLADELGDVYTVGRVEISTAIAFLAKLPNPKWALAGCGVLHRARKRFEWEKAPAVRLPAVALASLVHRLCGELTGSDRTQAETYWHEWFCPTVHAIVLGRPLVIEASARREMLYCGSDGSAYDWDRRYVFGWRQPWTPKLVDKEQWLLVPVDDKWERFFIESVAFGEYLYAETHMTYRNDGKGNGVRRRVFTWRNNSEHLAEDDARAHWQLLPVESSDSNRGEFMIYNAATHAYLISPEDVFDEERRHLFCMSTTRTSEPSDRVWRVLPQRMSAVDSGVAAFFGARYEDAEALFTRTLSDSESELLDDDERVKLLVLRASCRVRLGKKRQHGRADLGALEQIGGERAARTAGLHHVWKECAKALGVKPKDKETGDDGLLSAAAVLAKQRELMGRGDQLFVLKDVKKALLAYEEAATANVIDASDVLLLARQADAQMRCVKCLYVLHRPEEALAVIDTLASWMEDTNKTVAVREGTHVELLLWRARCERKLQRYDQASSTLVRALDALASFSTSTSTPLSAWLEQSIRMEVEVVKIFDKELVDHLMTGHTKNTKNEPTPEPAESTAEQLVHTLRCPLSFEFMRDPVLTPSGTTYERAMIECHLDTVGTWDPMTRKELRKDQLYPNRVLKVLLETMLSEHKLGNLLASCDE